MKSTEALKNAKSAVGIDPSDQADEDMRSVLRALNDLGASPIEHLTVEKAREQPTPADAVRKVLSDSGREMPHSDVRSTDILVAGAEGPNRGRLYKPAGVESGPLVLYFHGGGWVIADLDVYDATPRAIAEQSGAMVISVHYRQAPEHRFPAAHEDAFAAYRWLVNNAEKLGGDPQRIAVMGESAGGNLALNVSIWARDQGLPAPVHQVLIYPLVGTDLNTESYEESKHARPLNKAVMEWFMDKVLESPSDTESLLLNLVAEDLGNLPPTSLITAGIDPLRTEGEILADRLEEHGSTVRHRNYPGATHEFFGMAAVVEAARDAQRFVAEGLMESFSRRTH